MKLPRGQLLRSRVVTDPRTALVGALDRGLTGYAVLQPQDALLLDADGAGILTFAEGVPDVAYHTGTDRGGPQALADLAASGPYWLELYELDADALASLPDAPNLRVPPGMPARRLVGDAELVARTHERAPADRSTDGSTQDDETPDPVAAFLDDEAKVEAIRERAREQAEQRAQQWGFDDLV